MYHNFTKQIFSNCLVTNITNGIKEKVEFRRGFYLRDPDSVNSMVVGIARNEGCAVYLNGKEVFRDSNLRDNAAYNTLASTDLLEEDYQINVAVPISFIRDGLNVLAVEVHKSSRSTSNFSFDFIYFNKY